MKIALTCPASLPATQFGGILFLCVDIARELAKKDHEITIYTTDLDFANNTNTFNKHLPRNEKINGFTINRTHVFLKIYLFFVNPGMYNQIKNDQPEIIHAIGLRGFQAFISALVSKFHHIPLVLTDQGGLYTHPDFEKKGIQRILYKFQEPLIKFVIKQAKKIITANEYESSIFSKYCESSKLVIVRNGIDFENLQTIPFDFKAKHGINGRFLLFLGRFNRVKGIDLLLESFSAVCKQPEFDDVKLVIIGADFGYRTEMFKQIEDLQIKNRIKIIEKAARDEVISAYHACDFLVIPSRWEMSPLTPLEAFACKKTVISTKAHGIPYVIEDGKNGILVEPGDITNLTNSIIILLRDKEKTIKLGENGYKLVKEVCNSKNMAENVFQVYRSVVNSD
jgi:glycosyltransferase involved in cell wall biosynthesis